MNSTDAPPSYADSIGIPEELKVLTAGELRDMLKYKVKLAEEKRHQRCVELVGQGVLDKWDTTLGNDVPEEKLLRLAIARDMYFLTPEFRRNLPDLLPEIKVEGPMDWDKLGRSLDVFCAVYVGGRTIPRSEYITIHVRHTESGGCFCLKVTELRLKVRKDFYVARVKEMINESGIFKHEIDYLWHGIHNMENTLTLDGIGEGEVFEV